MKNIIEKLKKEFHQYKKCIKWNIVLFYTSFLLILQNVDGFVEWWKILMLFGFMFIATIAAYINKKLEQKMIKTSDKKSQI